MALKRCKHCHSDLPADTDHFSPRPKSQSRDGLYSWCKNCMREATSSWRSRQPASTMTVRNSTQTRRRRNDPAKYAHDLSKAKARYAELRIEVLLHYGLDKGCTCCGEKRNEFLALDHANNDGAEQRADFRAKGISGAAYWRWFIRNNFPPGFRVLCHNCNCARGFYGECPHEKEREAEKTG